MYTSKSFIATPPGATVKEQLENRRISQKEFALRMGMTEKHISNLINGKEHLTPDVAEKLEMVLGIPSGFWNKLEAIFREKFAKIKIENEADDDASILKLFPASEMINLGWIRKSASLMGKIIEMRKFFEVARLRIIVDETRLSCIACRRLSMTEKCDYALLAWAQKAKIEARSIDVGAVNLTVLNEKLSQIRSLNTKDPATFCSELKSILAGCGIALVILPHIKGSFLHGATFYDGKKIVIGLTFRGKDADKFWFSLFHELGHVLLGHLNKPDGLTDEDEKKADDFAKEILIPSTIFNAFTAANVFSASTIKEFAKTNNILCGIVLGRLQKEGFVPYNSRLNCLKTKILSESENIQSKQNASE
ncbi:helix-turn-helix domain-containing protein [uncultured Parasutterella sp.]|uniref:helix-turn-helix domain-containing protein n=1 Tax=uncultured Parasutterella sp. TaxID=1263098 RepID=UPI002595377F|nr:helix-turn-helix domain-containing protein [uncultured Parasutterella sp.]